MESESEEQVVRKTEKGFSEIGDFYDGRSVFITGASGFVGAVLLEALLRCCPGIRYIYILLREKKGVQPEERKEQIFQKRIFLKLKKENPDALKKVKVVPGDVVHSGLGISHSDFQMLEEDVSIVFHCAAVISFMKPLCFMIIQNVIGTQNVIALSKQLPKLKAFVYTSTAYANCNRMEEVKEEVYQLPISAKKFIETVTLEKADDLTTMQEQCTPPWPNTYTFSKVIAENLLLEEAGDLPLAIVRPSIVLCAWKGAVPGYTEEGAGIIDISIGIGKGFIRVLNCDEEKTVDIIPVDVVANTLIAASWSIATKRSMSPLVIHCTSGDSSPCSWGHFIHTLYRMQESHPLPKMYQKPGLVMRKHKATYWMSSFVNHYAPAYAIDCLLSISGRKPKLVSLYKFYDFANSYLSHFMLNQWMFRSDNYKKLTKQLNAKDSELLPLDIKGFSIDVISKSLVHGAPFYQWDIDKRNLRDRIPLAYRRYILTSFIKWTVILWLMLFVSFLITRLLQF